jgi:hypothetical protein
MEQLIPLIVQLIGGAAGGNAAGAGLKNVDLSTMLKTVLGAVGGVGGGQLATWLGILQAVMGDSANTTGGAIAGNVGASAIGGAILTVVVGLIKQQMSKSKA